MAPTKAQIKLMVAHTDSERTERWRILQPVVLSVVSALGGYEDVLVDRKDSLKRKKQKAISVEKYDDDDNDEEEEEEHDDENHNETENLTTEKVYNLGDECIGCLKDLKKFWRLDEDDEFRTIARILSFSKIVPNDLIPIIMSPRTDSEKKDNRVKLLCADLIAALTWPIDIDADLKEAQERESDEDRMSVENTDYSGLVDAQLSYKKDIIRTGAMAYIFKLILPSIQKTKKNLLALRDKPPTATSSGGAIQDSFEQSEFILQLHQFGIFDLLIHMSYGSSRFDMFGKWNMIVLDIWYLLFRGLEAVDLIDSESFIGTNSIGETASTMRTSDKKLANLLENEDRERKAKARKSNTRHSRFGTTLSVHTGDRKFNFHNQSAITTPVELAIDSRKRQKQKSSRLNDELGRTTQLKPSALKVLRKVVIEFIESGFNPFFSSVLKDIKMERASTQEKDTIRLLSLLGFFFKAFLTVRDREISVGISPSEENGHDFDLIAELVEPECIFWVVNKIKTGIEDNPLPIVEVHAAVECLIQQLLIIESLSSSGIEEYIEVANTIQNNLYYDTETLDMVINLMLLEKYSKNADHMFVRKKKRNKKSINDSKRSKLSADNDGTVNGVDEEDGLEVVVDQEEAEFQEIAEAEKQRFATDSITDTLMRYIRGYRDFSDSELMKRAVKLMHRQAVCAKSDGLFFKISTLNTFDSFIQSRNSMPKDSVYDDLFRFIDYILKKFFKSVRENPFTIVEALFKAKPSREQIQASNDGADEGSDSSEGDDDLKISKPKKELNLPAEIQIKPGLTWSQRLGVAVNLLVNKGKTEMVNKILDVLRTTSATRTAIVLISKDGDGDTILDNETHNEADIEVLLKNRSEEELSKAIKAIVKEPSKAVSEKFEDYLVNSDMDEKNDKQFLKALNRDSQLHVLLRELDWESEEGYPGYLEWKIPKKRLPGEIDIDIKIIDYFIKNPIDEVNGKSINSLTSRKRSTKAKAKKPKNKSRSSSTSSSSSEDVLNDGKKDKDKNLRKKAKKQQESKAYRSAQQLRLEIESRSISALNEAPKAIRPKRTGKSSSEMIKESNGKGMELDEVDEGKEIALSSPQANDRNLSAIGDYESESESRTSGSKLVGSQTKSSSRSSLLLSNDDEERSKFKINHNKREREYERGDVLTLENGDEEEQDDGEDDGLIILGGNIRAKANVIQRRTKNRKIVLSDDDGDDDN
ncbi:timeless protein-domain-containing protein [Phakopsora pachyrhizi]|nr:timeless protein-domain-containing protein [Phakopsora pachyrhizi]